MYTSSEYYFSIDNLCKDLFLRKHMDGQGYVPLSVIANFKRIKTLTEGNMSMDNLRYACQQVKSVEVLPGIDGDDCLRRREGWRDFVLPIEDRVESARHDGALHTAESLGRQMQQEQPMPLEPGFSFGQFRAPNMNMAPGNGLFQSNSPMTYLPGAAAENHVVGEQPGSPFDEGMNGANSRPSFPGFSRTSSNAMRSPPTEGPPAQGNFVNGHHRQGSRADIEENVFPDEQIPNINIRMQPQAPSAAKSYFPGIAHVASGGSPSGHNHLDREPSDASQHPAGGLRGGASSPQQ
jgi:hypothetical protein